jgi:hypothetical protein
MVNAVENVKQRLLRATGALKAHNVPYAVVGGNAVAAWVATVDEAAVRNTQHVDVLIRRADFDQARAALEAERFVHHRDGDRNLFVEHANASVRHAVRLHYSGDVVSTDPWTVNPDVNESVVVGTLRVLDLNALVAVELGAFQVVNSLNVRDLIDVELVDSRWLHKLAPELAVRLQLLLDTPNG